MLWTALAVLQSLALAFAVMGFIFFFIDLRVHGGVTIFKRRHVLRSGTSAPARILSDEMLDKRVVRFGALRSAYSIVYEVLPPGGQPFRAKGIEVMTLVEDNANLRAARRAALDGTGVTVQVRFDPQSHVVVLVRVDAKKWEREHEAARQKAKESLLR